MKTQTAPGLEAVGAALVDADAALAAGPQGERAHDALVALARASYDALARWEAAQVPSKQEPPPASAGLTARVQRWRGQLDELRVQAALAEMELHDASQTSLTAAERSLHAVEEQLNGARRDVGEALTRLRDEVRTRL